MHASLFDSYRHGDSPIHRLDPRVKVLSTVGFVLSTALLPERAWWAYGLSLPVVLGLSLWSGLGASYPLVRSLVALPFLAAAGSVAFVVPGRPVFGVWLGPWMLTITDAGLARWATVLARGLLSVQMASLLAATTPFPDIIHALRHLRAPAVLVATLAFLYRYLFILGDEALRLLRARDARRACDPARSSRPPVLWQARVAGQMAGFLFLRSVDRAERIYGAMLARGYRGHLLTLRQHRMQHRDWLAAALAVSWLALIQLIARLPLANPRW